VQVLTGKTLSKGNRSSIVTSLIYIAGQLSGKPQILQTRNGKPWAKILVEEEVARERGQGTPNILPITLFGRAAERAKELQRGDRLTVACRLQGTRFEIESGEIRYSVQLVGKVIYLATVSETK
jgi:single-stranded DNA-binding protein